MTTSPLSLAGLQKMTLLDYPGQVACTLFLPGCNFRCPFCHNSGLLEKAEPAMDMAQFLQFLEKRKGLLDAVCVSGGEPTLQPRLPELLTAVKAMGFKVKLDTNGSRPEVLKALAQHDLLDYVAMDVKSSPAGYCAAAGLCAPDLNAVEESLRFLITGTLPYELRTTVVRELHSEENMEEMGRWLFSLADQKPRQLYLQCFVDRDSVLSPGLHAPSREDLERYAAILVPYIEKTALRGV